MILALTISKRTAATMTKEITVSGFASSLTDAELIEHDFNDFHTTTLSTTKTTVLPSSITGVPTSELIGATLPTPAHSSIFS